MKATESHHKTASTALAKRKEPSEMLVVMPWSRTAGWSNYYRSHTATAYRAKRELEIRSKRASLILNPAEHGVQRWRVRLILRKW